MFAFDAASTAVNEIADADDSGENGERSRMDAVVRAATPLREFLLREPKSNVRAAAASSLLLHLVLLPTILMAVAAGRSSGGIAVINPSDRPIWD